MEELTFSDRYTSLYGAVMLALKDKIKQSPYIGQLDIPALPINIHGFEEVVLFDDNVMLVKDNILYGEANVSLLDLIYILESNYYALVLEDQPYHTGYNCQAADFMKAVVDFMWEDEEDKEMIKAMRWMNEKEFIIQLQGMGFEVWKSDLPFESLY